MFIVLVGAGQNDIPLQYLPTYQPTNSHICLIDPTICDEVYAVLLSLADDNTIITLPFDQSLIIPELDTWVICYTEEVTLSKLTSSSWTTIYCPYRSNGFPLDSLETKLDANSRLAVDKINIISQDSVSLYSRDRVDDSFITKYNDICIRIIGLYSSHLTHPIIVQLLSGLLSSDGLFTGVGALIYDRGLYTITYQNIGEYRIKLVTLRHVIE